jgi:hypothetical protein
MAAEYQQLNTSDRFSNNRHLSHEFHRAAALLPAFVQLSAALLSTSSHQYRETTKHAWESLQSVAPELGMDTRLRKSNNDH